jgi:hypothetical protein
MAPALPWPKGAATAAALVMGMEGGGGGTHPTGSGGAGMEDGGLDIGCGRCLCGSGRCGLERADRKKRKGIGVDLLGISTSGMVPCRIPNVYVCWSPDRVGLG